MKKIAYILLPLFLAGVLFSVWKIICIERELRSGDDEYNYLAEIASGDNKPKKDADQNQSENENISAPEKIDSHTEIDFVALQKYNPDIIAWIMIPRTDIDYPVVQGPDNVKYLRHTPDGEYSVAGSIFLEFSNASDFSDNHSIIYGHHFRGSYRPMFTQLVDYRSSDFFKTHPTAVIYTPAGRYTVRFFSCYVTKLGDNAWRTSFCRLRQKRAAVLRRGGSSL